MSLPFRLKTVQSIQVRDVEVSDIAAAAIAEYATLPVRNSGSVAQTIVKSNVQEGDGAPTVGNYIGLLFLYDSGAGNTTLVDSLSPAFQIDVSVTSSRETNTSTFGGFVLQSAHYQLLGSQDGVTFEIFTPQTVQTYREENLNSQTTWSTLAPLHVEDAFTLTAPTATAYRFIAVYLAAKIAIPATNAGQLTTFTTNTSIVARTQPPCAIPPPPRLKAISGIVDGVPLITIIGNPL